MSYARFSDSDVYVYAHVDGFVECCGCFLDGACHRLTSADEVVAHMGKHIEAGHDVPEYLTDPELYPAEDFEPYEDPDVFP